MGGVGGGLYEKGNLEIHSSDYCKHSDCDSNYPRRDIVYITPFPDPFPVKGQGGGRRRGKPLINLLNAKTQRRGEFNMNTEDTE